MASGYDPLLTGFLFTMRKDTFPGKEKQAFFGAKIMPAEAAIVVSDEEDSKKE